MPQEALAVAEAGILEHPENPELNILHGEALKLAGRYAQAETAFRKALDLDQQNPAPNVSLGDLMAANRNPEAARQYYLKALASPFVSADIMLTLVERFQAMNDSTEARKILNRLRGMNLSQDQVARLETHLSGN